MRAVAAHTPGTGTCGGNMRPAPSGSRLESAVEQLIARAVDEDVAVVILLRSNQGDRYMAQPPAQCPTLSADVVRWAGHQLGLKAG